MKTNPDDGVLDNVPSASARAANYLEVERKFQTGELRPLVPLPMEPDTPQINREK